MRKINICYDNEHVSSVYLVRYFRFRNNVYFIYTLQEKDDRDYMKLYVVKVMKELGNLVTQTVRRPDEWNRMKAIIKQILSEIKRQNLSSIEDLDSSELENIIIYENRSFRIASDLVYILANEIVSKDNNENFIEKIATNKNIEAGEEIEVLDLDDDQKIDENIGTSIDESPENIEKLELNDFDSNIVSESEIEVLEL